MSFLAKLELDGETYNVIEFDLHITQEVDHNGKPQTIAQGGNIRLVLESTKSVDFMKWMISSTQTKNGKITFYRRDAMSKMKELKFEKAFCINFHESFRSNNEIPMQIELLLSAKDIDFGGAVLGKPWSLDL
ncbi:MAG: type VI secretion system tube protein TssD [Flavobacterium sp.]